MSNEPIKLVLCDVDGTLVTNDKLLTEATIDAVGRLRDAGIRFAITSGRPPRGLAMLFDPLSIDTPIATFDGAIVVDTDLIVLKRRTVPGHLVGPVLEALESNGMDVWVYKDDDWLVRDLDGAHIAKETATVRFSPTLVPDFSTIGENPDGVVQVVGISDDLDAMSIIESDMRTRFGDELTITRSQPYYLDLTHPEANKGTVVEYYADRYDLPTDHIATIGDMPTDMLMFARSGLSIAMGNASSEVQHAACHVTTSNEEEGFATAVERYILIAN